MAKKKKKTVCLCAYGSVYDCVSAEKNIEGYTSGCLHGLGVKTHQCGGNEEKEERKLSKKVCT